MTRARPIDIGDIVHRLGTLAPALCLELLPNGVREGKEWRVGSVGGEPGRSMAVHLEGPRAGVWADFSTSSDRGDALDLVAGVLFRGDKKRALAWSRAWLGIDNVNPDTFARETAAAREKKQRQAKSEEARIRGLAQNLFIAGKPIAGTLAELYLLGRGIDFRALGRQPGALRFHPEVFHPETGALEAAMVAAITSPDHELVAVHRTYLERLADGRVVKLRGVEDAKLTLGRYAGGCIRLWRGASGKAWRDMAPGEGLIIGEGIEDTATGVIACPELRAAVAVSLANMGSLVLPDEVAEVIILGQNDPEENPHRPGEPHPARLALERAIAHHHRAGKRVRLARPPAGQAKDLNELAQRQLQPGTAS